MIVNHLAVSFYKMPGSNLPFQGTCVLFTLCYYTYVVEFVIFSICSYCTQLVYLIVFHILYILSFTLFIITAYDRGWSVPAKYTIPDDIFDNLRKAYLQEEDGLLVDMCKERNIQVRMRTKEGVKRVCYRCRIIKPDRAYHCRRCKKCVCRMDHHCYFLQNCIGHSNMKYFIFLNVYTALMTYFCAITEIDYIIKMVIVGHDVGIRITLIIISAIVRITIGIACTAMTIMSLHVISRNTSIVELKHSPIFQSNIRINYDRGYRSNFKEFCGNIFVLWFLPCRFDGCNSDDPKRISQTEYEKYIEEDDANKEIIHLSTF